VLGQRLWSVVQRALARNGRFVWRRASHRRRRDGGFNTTADPGATTAAVRENDRLTNGGSPKRGG
jgi:hypothetical protein